MTTRRLPSPLIRLGINAIGLRPDRLGDGIGSTDKNTILVLGIAQLLEGMVALVLHLAVVGVDVGERGVIVVLAVGGVLAAAEEAFDQGRAARPAGVGAAESLLEEARAEGGHDDGDAGTDETDGRFDGRPDGVVGGVPCEQTPSVIMVSSWSQVLLHVTSIPWSNRYLMRTIPAATALQV